ncbi:ABC-F family ATP-binding cassette domain-containing protein [Paenalkalicoccus suaedae]|uniref:ABC-F family ATP-binding cassette domain-containing protein n=1 Tax=Paenalkalicoccus suaedae TaxID=2592382 RepID=A0A859FI39_9BACI|nr:ABC-F family ATP-binding cassette domain-containing protein [Paenalkalicoccus suaedae]QKS72817.1 ABC-F family ATP-binding cassette domain-containing protein [Paenalkalicoccus suaedae]
MTLINLHDITCEQGDRTLFTLKQASINKKDRIGLVGRNGSGKTTLLNMLAGTVEPTKGTVTATTTVALLPQLKPRRGQKSGGEVSQEVIYELLADEAGVLLADEPTTHLDTPHIERLEKQLRDRPEALIVVSHDRAFLDAICTQIWEIRAGEVHMFTGNYSDFERLKAEEERHHEREYEKYERKKRQLELAVTEKEKRAQRATKKPKNVSASEASITGAKPYFAKKQKKLNQGAKAMQTRLEQLEKVEKPEDLPELKMQVANEEKLGRRLIIRGEKVAGRIGARELWREFDLNVRAGEKVAIIGANGSGKTTLLNMIMRKAEPIYVSPAVSFGYFDQLLEGLSLNETILKNVELTSIQDETTVRTVLARLGFMRDDVFKKVGVLSGGERVKVSLAKLFVSSANVLVLDEPTSYLDIDAVQALESLLASYPGTILYVSHDRRFLENTATRILSFEDGVIQSVEGGYTALEQEEAGAEPTSIDEERMKVEMEITRVLSELSVAPSEDLEQTFQELLRQKRELAE